MIHTILISAVSCYNIVAMFSKFRIYSTMFSLLFLAGLLVNWFLLKSPILGGIWLIFALLLFGSELGKGLTSQESRVLQWWKGTFFFLSLLMIIGSGFYYVHSFTFELAAILILAFIPLMYWRGAKRTPLRKRLFWHDLFKGPTHNIPWSVLLIIILCGLFLWQAFALLLQSGTLEAIRSPWTMVPHTYFLTIGLAAFLLITLLLRGRERFMSIPLTGIFLLAGISVAIFVYPLGYGFDSFIHQATEEHIALYGSITPKPLYYTGQYILVLLTHYVFLLPVDLVDTWLVPVLTSLLLPFAWFGAAAHLLKKRRLATTTAVGLLLLPLSSFIVTTPQGLANLWIILTICASIPYLLSRETPRIFTLLIAAIATILIHPLAGIPLFVYLALLASQPQQINTNQQPIARIIFWGIAILGCIVLPASFVAQATLSGGTGLDLSQFGLTSLVSALSFDVIFTHRFSPLLDGVYVFGTNILLILLVLGLIAWKKTRKKLNRKLDIFLIMAVMLFVNYLLLSTLVDFSFLIDYERANYANRLLPISTYFLIPIYILGIGWLFKRMENAPYILRITLTIFLAALVASNIYLTYPREDVYDTSHGINVSQADVDAVYLVDDETRPYAVLANQSVSAAAIRHLGFENRYFHDQYFYPVPTGGAFYNYFLEMNAHPTKETAMEALGLVKDICALDATCIQPEALYYIVDSYWWEASRIIETSKGIADDWFSVGNGNVFVFRFEQEESEENLESIE